MARSIALSKSPLSGTYKADGAIYQYMAVKAGTDDHQVAPLDSGDTSGTIIVGIAQNDANDTEAVEVVILGPTKARAEGSVTRDDLLEAIYDATANKNGNLKTLSALANGKMIAALAEEDAADGENFWVNLIKQMQFATS